MEMNLYGARQKGTLVVFLWQQMVVAENQRFANIYEKWEYSRRKGANGKSLALVVYSNSSIYLWFYYILFRCTVLLFFPLFFSIKTHELSIYECAIMWLRKSFPQSNENCDFFVIFSALISYLHVLNLHECKLLLFVLESHINCNHCGFRMQHFRLQFFRLFASVWLTICVRT